MAQMAAEFCPEKEAGCISGLAAMAVALTIGTAYAVGLFGWDVASGAASFWSLPFALQGGGIDIRTGLSGYHWLAREGWVWPLLRLDRAGAPASLNGYLFDPIPALGLLAKAVRSLSGHVPDLWPLWLTGAFALNAAALVGLARALGNRSLTGAILAAGLGAMAPVVHHRFGHLALMAHWLPVFALALYVRGQSGARLAPGITAGLLALSALSTGVTLYLYVMTGAIAAACLVQAMVDGRIHAGRGDFGAAAGGGLRRGAALGFRRLVGLAAERGIGWVWRELDESSGSVLAANQWDLRRLRHLPADARLNRGHERAI